MRFSFLLFFLLLIVLGCINVNERANIDCRLNDQSVSKDSKVICLYNKAMYLAAANRVGEALNACNNMKMLYQPQKSIPLLGTLFKALDIVSFSKRSFYNQCITRVATFAEDESICSNVDKAGALWGAVERMTKGIIDFTLVDEEHCRNEVKRRKEIRNSYRNIIDRFISYYSNAQIPPSPPEESNNQQQTP